MASPQTNDFNFPHFPPPPPPPSRSPPPPPFNPRAPPPPHVHPPPPSPPSDNHPTVIVIVLISFGSLFFLAFLAAALFCFLKKKKKKQKAVQEVEIIHADEHKKVKEAIIPGPHGTQSVMLSIEDDVHIEEVIAKKEKFGHAGLHAKSAQGESGSTNKERGSSSSFDQQQFDKSLDHKSITPS